MKDSQREAMYNAWSDSKKWTDIDLKNVRGTWKATAKEVPSILILRDTKQQAIYAITGALNAQGYEISNLAEIQGYHE